MPPPSAAPTIVYDLFISYSTQDKAWVRGELLTRLEAAGLKACIDFRDFQLGAPTVTEIERGLLTSRKTLLVLTPAYLTSGWTEFENLLLQTADPTNRLRRLIPLLKERCNLPQRIGFLTYVDFTDPTERDFAWRKLLATLDAPATPAPATSSVTASAAAAPSTPSPMAMRQLRTVLAQLYPDKSSATRIAQDAGLPVAMIALGDRAVDYWHAILGEAQKRNQLPTLLAIVREEYGTNGALVAAIQAVLSG